MVEPEGQHGRSGRGTALHALGNVFLGISLGLLGYYFLTDLVTGTQQRALIAELPPAVAQAAPRPVAAEPTFDFEGWAQEDRAYWRKLKEGQVFGRLVAPDMDLDEVVVKGTSRRSLMKGPGWITWSDLPGPTGNAGISGHRTTYGAPFRKLDKLEPGDTVTFYSPYRVYTYRVRKVFAVAPTRVEVVASTKKPMLTMTACHPPFSARQRLSLSLFSSPLPRSRSERVRAQGGAMRVYVTGGAGFIGSNLVQALLAGGHDVMVVDDLSVGTPDNLDPRAGFRKLDILDEALAAHLGPSSLPTSSSTWLRRLA